MVRQLHRRRDPPCPLTAFGALLGATPAPHSEKRLPRGLSAAPAPLGSGAERSLRCGALQAGHGDFRQGRARERELSPAGAAGSAVAAPHTDAGLAVAQGRSASPLSRRVRESGPRLGGDFCVPPALSLPRGGRHSPGGAERDLLGSLPREERRERAGGAGNFLSLGEEEEERGEQEGWPIVHRGCIFVRLALVAIVRREGERERRERERKKIPDPKPNRGAQFASLRSPGSSR